MVEVFQKILQQIVTEKGQVRVFAIIKMDELTDRWTIVLSAPWATEKTHEESFNYVFGLIKKSFNPEDLSTIARIGFFSKEEHLIEELLKYQSGTQLKEDVRLNGNIVHEAYIFASNKEI